MLARVAIVCVMLIAGARCESQKCTSSAECPANEICVGAGNSPFQCLRACATSADCRAGTTCTSVTSADCPVCDEVTLACVAATQGG